MGKKGPMQLRKGFIAAKVGLRARDVAPIGIHDGALNGFHYFLFPGIKSVYGIHGPNKGQAHGGWARVHFYFLVLPAGDTL